MTPLLAKYVCVPAYVFVCLCVKVPNVFPHKKQKSLKSLHIKWSVLFCIPCDAVFV